MKALSKKVALASCIIAGSTGPATASDTITLRMAGFVPESHYMIEYGSKVFRDEVVKLTDGQVKWQYYPNQQLGKAMEMLSVVNNNVVDISEPATSYHPDKLPLTSIMELPGSAENSCEYTAALRPLVEPGGIIYENEYRPNNLRVLSLLIQEPYTIHGTKDISSVSDFEGLKLRPTGAGQDLTVEALGAVGVRVPSSEMYEAVSRGIIDAVFNTITSVKNYGLLEVAKHSFTGYNFGTSSLFLVMSEKKFQSLPEDIQDDLIAAGKTAEQSFCQYAYELEQKNIQEAEESGIDVHVATKEERAELDDKLSSVSERWAEQHESQDRPANDALEAFNQALKEYRESH